MLGGRSASPVAGDRRGQGAAVPSDCTSLWQQKSLAEGGQRECDWSWRVRFEESVLRGEGTKCITTADVEVMKIS